MIMSTEVADYLATRIQTNIRELEGALNQLLAYCEMHGMEPTIDAVKFVLAAVSSAKTLERQTNY